MRILNDSYRRICARRYRNRRVRPPGPFKQLPRALGRSALTACRIRAVVRLGVNLCSRRERELASHDDCFVWFQAVFDHGEIAILSLSWSYRAKIDRVV